MDRASRGLRILTCACVVFSSADVGDISNRHSQSDWRAAPAVVAYKEFLARERYLWKGTAFAVDSQVRWVGGPGLTRAEEPPLLFLLDRATLALAPSSHFAEFHPYSVADTMELMVSVRMRAHARPKQDSVFVMVLAARHHLYYYAEMTLVRRRNGWTVTKYQLFES